MPIDQHNKINIHFQESSKLIKLSLVKLHQPIIQATDLIFRSFLSGGKLLVCGNGGSAAESQHFAAELVGRYLKKRKALPVIALSTDTSVLTAIGNDYGFTKLFSRQVQALAKSGDVLLCISTSGTSKNILAAAKIAKSLGLKVIGLTGNSGGKLKVMCDVNLVVPSETVPYIQELHLVIIHTLCDLVESNLSAL